jgi:hypothetical protein
VAVIRPALPEDHFTRVPNAWLRDPNLDPAPKAYLAYLLTHAAGYRCSTSQASRDMGVNRSTVSAWNSKLVERGYFLAVEQPRAGAGRFAENDYTLTPCTASAPPLPENPSLFPRETAQSTDTVKPRTVEPTRSDRARSTQHIEEQGEKNTPPPTEEGATADRHLRSVDAEVAAAQVIASEHYEATGKLGGSRAFLALRGIVAGALKAGHAPEQIRPALAHLRQRGRPVTNSTLGPLLADPRLAESVTGARYGPRAPIPADADAHRGAF